MRPQLPRLALRAIAIGIAVAGLIDPAWTVSRSLSQKLVAIEMTAAPAIEVEHRLRANLPGWDVEPRAFESRLPCGPEEHCVMMADGSMDSDVPDDLAKPLSLIVVNRDEAPNVSVRSAVVSRGHQSAAGVARVELVVTGLTPEPGGAAARSEIRVLDGDAVIGSASYEWSNASTNRLRDGQTATIDVPWWPIDTGARALRIETVPLEGEQTRVDNHINVGVTVATTRVSILVFDARPSWNSTFVRRALEDDARFVVSYRTRLAPALTAGTANGRLDTAALDRASVVVIGGPDGLTSTDVALLEQFVTVRGGTLVLLPERAPTGPWSRLLPAAHLRQDRAGQAWSEHLSDQPEPVGPLHATEVLRTDQPPVTATVVARARTSAAIVVAPSGNGRIVVSGAMDAWRYRDASFDTFWRSLVAEGAAWGEGTQLVFDRGLGARGSRAPFTIRDRRMVVPEASQASAVGRCGAGPAFTIRLWPGGRPGEFTGELPLALNGFGEAGCTIEASIGDRMTIGGIAVADQPAAGLEHTLSKLEQRVTTTGGLVARSGEEDEVARVIAAAGGSLPVAATAHPMRTAWWALVFAGCVSIEWWLRRRSGLR